MRAFARSCTTAALLLALGCGRTVAGPGAQTTAPPPGEARPPASASTPPPPRPGAPAPAAADEQLHTLEASVVTEAPPAVYLLARPEEPNAADCEAALLRRARRLGANRLHVERSGAGCRGGAYMVQPRPEAQSAGPGGAQDYGEALHGWMAARWRRPPGVSDAELRRLCVVTRIWTTPELRIWKVLAEPVRRSGNAAFDESVRTSLEAAIDEAAPLPEPKAVETSRVVCNAMLTFSFAPAGNAACR